ncbi:MAG: ATP-binding protein [Nitrospirota bacterium]
MAGVNVYALLQLRQLTSLSTDLVAYHTPAIESAKRLTSSLYAQLRSEKKFWVLHDEVFLREFDEEAAEFTRNLSTLLQQDPAQEGQQLLGKTQRLYEAYRRLLREATPRPLPRASLPDDRYTSRRDALVDGVADSLDAYVGLHEALMRTVVNESRTRSAQAEAIMRRLVVVAILLGLGLAAVASYSILRPLRRVQDHIRQIGQGKFGETVQVEAPSDLRELVETVNWMGKKLQELDDMKADFLAHISHELRTPLASIREGTHLLLDEIPGPLSPNQRETLQIMQDSSQRLIRLISTLLDLSKIEAGLMQYQIVLTDLAQVAENSVGKVRLLAEGKRIQLLTEAPHERTWVPMDGARIEQVVDNLLSNALKFSPDGACVGLHIEMDRKKNLVLVSVSDTGAGIPSEDLPHIFDRFYQGRTSARSQLAGSGLGLAFAKRVVEAHGGRIWAESEPGKGTTVTFTLPLTQPRSVA